MNFLYDFFFLPYLDYRCHTLLTAVGSWFSLSILSLYIMLCLDYLMGFYSEEEDACHWMKAHLAELSSSLVYKWKWIH